MPSSLKKTEKKIYPESYSIEEEVHKQNSNKTTIVKEVPQSYKKYERVGRWYIYCKYLINKSLTWITA